MIQRVVQLHYFIVVAIELINFHIVCDTFHTVLQEVD